MKYSILDIVIFSTLLFGLFILGDLSYRNFTEGDICPKFSILPACYIAFMYLLFLFIFNLNKKFTLPFILLAGFGLTISTFASVGHLFGTVQCPISEVGVPTCFIGFSIFLVLLILKFLQVRIEKF